MTTATGANIFTLPMADSVFLGVCADLGGHCREITLSDGLTLTEAQTREVGEYIISRLYDYSQGCCDEEKSE